MSTMRYVSGNYTLCRLLTFRSKLDIDLLFVFDYNINHYNTLKMKKELFLFVFLSVFLIDLGAQIKVPRHGIPLSILASVNPCIKTSFTF